MSILKANRYRIVANSAFEMPLPLNFRVMKKNSPVASYEISADETIMFHVITKYKEEMITPLNRKLTISDIYYLFSCRVFQDRTPYTAHQLSQLGLSKYNVYDILCKTRGITPFDTYWIKFDGDECDYDEALEIFNSLLNPEPPPAPAPTPEPEFVPDLTPPSLSDILGERNLTQEAIEALFEARDQIVENSNREKIDEILSQHTIDVDAVLKLEDPMPVEIQENTAEDSDDDVDDNAPLVNNKMTLEEIESLLRSVGLSDYTDEEPALEPELVPASDGGKLSDDAIAALFAANAANNAPEPAPALASEGGKLSDDAIAALFAANAANNAPEPEPAPASEGGKLSDDAIAALFAANAANNAPEPAPAPAPAAGGGKLSDDAIAALFAANAANNAPEPAPASEGGKLSDDAIAALFAANAASNAPEPAPVLASEGGKLSDDAIAALFAANAANNAPEPAPASDGGGKLSQDEIEALLQSMQDDANK